VSETYLAELSDDGARINVTAPLAANESVRAVPGARFERGRWSVPRTWAACLALRGTFGSALAVGPRLVEWSIARREEVDRSLALRNALDVEDVAAYDPRLRPFQRAGVAWLLSTLDGALLTDDLGSGKTVQACAAIAEAGLRRGLVVAPKSVLSAWAQHFETWTDLRPVLIRGTATKRRKALEALAAGEADVGIVGWESLHAHTRLAQYGQHALTDKEREPKELNALDLEFLVADEVHRAQDPNGRMTRAYWAMADQVRYRIGLTGTPVGNHLGNLWSVMRGVAPAEYPVKGKWEDRYCEVGYNRFGGREVVGPLPANDAELRGFLNPRLRSMPKGLVLPDLPPRVGGLDDPNGLQIRWAEMTPKQAKAFAQMRDLHIAELESGAPLVATTAPTVLARLSQLASAYGTVEETTRPDGTVSQRLVLEEPSGKLDVLEELLDGELADEPSVVVFTVSSQLARLAAARLERRRITHGLVIGGQSGVDRDEEVRRFQNGTTRVLVATDAAGGTGLTLTRARVTVYLQRSFSYINAYQSEGRTHRIGSEQHDRVIYLDVQVPNSPDQRAEEVLKRKSSIAEEVTQREALLEMLKGMG
jgi:SNF2 family DNA or RNA helicase